MRQEALRAECHGWRMVMSRGFLLALLLTGCVSFEPKPLTPAQSAAEFGLRSLADADLQRFIELNDGEGSPRDSAFVWDFDSLTLAAFYFHPELDVARAQWSAAAAARIAAGERPNPVLGFAPAYNTTTSDPSPRLVTLTTDMTLETAGKRAYRIAQAEQLAEAARLNVSSVAWRVRSNVRSALLELYGARESEALLEQQQAIHTENVRIVQSQFDAGAVSAFELTQARLAANRARLDLRDAQRRRAEARVQLASAMGVPVTSLEDVDLSFSGFGGQGERLDSAELRSQALVNRPDVLAALAEYAASESKLQLEIARQYPDLHIGPGYEYDQGDDKWSVGLSLSLPVFNRNGGAIAAAEASRTEAAARFNAVQAGVLSEIDLATAAYRAATQKQADADSLLANLNQQEQRAQAMLELREISRSELAALQLELSVSALARLNATLELERAAGRLEDAIQSPLGLSPNVWERSPRLSQYGQTQD